jgi:hypothetical protein
MQAIAGCIGEICKVGGWVYAKSMGGIRKLDGFDMPGGWVCRVGLGDMQGGLVGFAGWVGGWDMQVGGWDMQGGCGRYAGWVGGIFRASGCDTQNVWAG